LSDGNSGNPLVDNAALKWSTPLAGSALGDWLALETTFTLSAFP
jgi:hypothetical protein